MFCFSFKDNIKEVHNLVDHGDLNGVEDALNSGKIKINDKCKEDGYTLLMVACMSNQRRIVDFLMKQPNIDPNVTSVRGYTALIFAAEQNLVDIVDILLSHPDIDPNLSKNKGKLNPLLYASQNDHFETVKRLLSDERINVNYPEILPDKPDKNRRPLIYFPIVKNRIRIVKLFLSSSHTVEFEPCVWQVAGYDCPEMVKLLLTTNADPNAKDNDGNTPLILASKFGRTEVVLALLEDERVDPNLSNWNEAYKRFETPLSHSTRAGYVEITNALLNHPRIIDENLEKYKKMQHFTILREKQEEELKYHVF